jgi:predicted ABC-type transport system involved in lysophospholipase L1 biosynthesis ATPase subunit
VSTRAIELDGIFKSYGRTVALDGLSLVVGRGELVGLLSPNGAGKTTTIKLLLGLARPSGGTGRVLGAPLGDRGTRARIGYLPELFRYQPWLRAREVLRLHSELAGLLGQAAEASRWVLPSDGLWRGVIYGLEPPLLVLLAAGEAPRLAEANPFYAAAPPAPLFVIWSVVWMGLVLGLAAWRFDRRDL